MKKKQRQTFLKKTTLFERPPEKFKVGVYRHKQPFWPTCLLIVMYMALQVNKYNHLMSDLANTSVQAISIQNVTPSPLSSCSSCSSASVSLTLARESSNFSKMTCACAISFRKSSINFLLTVRHVPATFQRRRRQSIVKFIRVVITLYITKVFLLYKLLKKENKRRRLRWFEKSLYKHKGHTIFA